MEVKVHMDIFGRALSLDLIPSVSLGWENLNSGFDLVMTKNKRKLDLLFASLSTFPFIQPP
jgi:hypothetical protein